MSRIDILPARKWFDGFTRMSHLSEALAVMPEIDKQITYVQNDDLELSGLLNKINGGITTKLVSSERYEWYVQSKHITTKMVTVTGPPQGNGANGSFFQITLEDDFFKSNEVVEFQSGTQCIIYGEPVSAAGGGFEYTMQCLDKARTLHPDQDSVGSNIVFRYNLHPADWSDKGTSRMFIGEKFTTGFTTMRMGAGITRAAMSQCIPYRFTASNGDKKFFWQTEQERQFKQQWAELLELWMWHGQQTNPDNLLNVSHLRDVNTNVIRASSGLWEYLRDAQQHWYIPNHDNNYEFWQDIISSAVELSPSRMNKKFTLFCGISLYKQFQKDMWRYLQRYNISSSDIAFSKNGKKTDVGTEFDTMYGLFGCSLQLKPVWSWNNRSLYGHQNNKATGATRQSYKGVLIDMSIVEGENNLHLLYKGADGTPNSKDIEWEVPGAVSMVGNPGRFRASRIDGTEMWKLTECALVFKYPYSSIVIEPAF
jgi:hypothetical protein